MYHVAALEYCSHELCLEWLQGDKKWFKNEPVLDNEYSFFRVDYNTDERERYIIEASIHHLTRDLDSPQRTMTSIKQVPAMTLNF